MRKYDARCEPLAEDRKRSRMPVNGKAGPLSIESALDLSSAFTAHARTLHGMAVSRGFTLVDAEDVVQDFFLEAARADWLEKYDPAKGRAQSFISEIFRRFLTKAMAKRRALKRGWGRLVGASFEEEREQTSENVRAESRSPETLFQEREVGQVLDRAISLLKQELNGKANPRTFEALIPFLDAKGEHVSYRTLGATLGLSAGAARMKVMRLRQRLRSYVFMELEIECPQDAQPSELVAELFRCLDQ